MKKAIALLAVAATLSGCATVNTQPIAPTVASKLKASTINHTTRSAPSFTAMTPGKAAFGLLGAAAMVSAGNQIITDHSVDDPANAIAASLGTALTSAHGATKVSSPIQVASDEIADIAGAAKDGSKFIIDVQTINWSLVYFPTDWTHYRVIYSAKARLIDVDNKAVVAEGFCSRMPESNAGAPTYDELLADQARRLKKELSTAADECIQALKQDMLVL